ncbi:response regulator [Roseovarius sp. CAU 1744]|uniref:response regulator n=1 Tax=Roseovarius sp. CAU 1744 TaxID=3140368 RepID=UPI00325ABAA7
MANRKRILIVEDDTFMRFMIKQIIETLGVGLEVDVANDGVSACEKIELNPDSYALILMDVHMPNLSGIEATKRLRSNSVDPPRDIPVIAVTADTGFHHPLAVQSHGMNGYLPKPISPGDLNSLIDKYCEIS